MTTTKRRSHHTYITDSPLDRLIRMSEAELQANVVEPLLQKMGFTDVRDTSGPNERGKDLVAIKHEEFGKAKLYAIQIKKLRFTGKYDKTTSLTHVITQLRQLFKEPVNDPRLNAARLPDRCMFITPYPIDSAALEAAFHQLLEIERQEITVVDGVRLADEALRCLPAFRSTQDPESGYKAHLADQVASIPESAAFGLSYDLSLDQIFVDLACENAEGELHKLGVAPAAHHAPWFFLGDSGSCQRIESFFLRQTGKKPICSFPTTPYDRSLFRRQLELQNAKGLLQKSGSEFRLKPKLQTCPVAAPALFQTAPKAQAKGEGVNNLGSLGSPPLQKCTEQEEAVISCDFSPIIKHIQQRCIKYRQGWKSMLSNDFSYEQCLAVFRLGAAVSKHLKDLFKSDPFFAFWQYFQRSLPGSAGTITVNASSLERVKHSIFITGGPGAGKTTILRRLAYLLTGRAGDQLPILVYLNRVREPSKAAILDACRKELALGGMSITRGRFKKDLRIGRFRLLLDGLDETGTQAPQFMELLQTLDITFPRASMIVTCRNTYQLINWERPLKLQVMPFTRSQTSAFVKNWFTSAPSKVKQVRDWLAGNEDMRHAARTPINAALICTLVQSCMDLPTNEAEMYDRRLDLLLGSWEQAKRIAPMSIAQRKAYKLFLMELAADLHRHGLRLAPLHKVEQLATTYASRGTPPMVEDCIHRSLLLVEADGKISFGHLAYQEFLVAKWLGHHQPFDLILDKMGEAWWANVLRLYATLHGDLGPLCRERKRRGFSLKQARYLLDLAQYAPFTHIPKDLSP